MAYSREEIVRAVQRVDAIDEEHGETPDAYLDAVGLDPFAVTVAFIHADRMWAVTRERLRLDPENPITELVRDELRQAAAASMLRGMVIGAQLP